MESFFSSLKTERTARKVYRALLQFASTPFKTGLSQPNGVRSKGCGSLNRVSTELGAGHGNIDKFAFVRIYDTCSHWMGEPSSDRATMPTKAGPSVTA